MKPLRDPNEPIQNLMIGKIIEVDGTHIVAELETSIVDLARVYGGDVYPIGQFGSIVKIHSGRRLIFGYVGRLRLKADYEREIGIVSLTTGSTRVIEADLFGEGEWNLKTVDNTPKWHLDFERGVTNFPLPQQGLYLTPRSELGPIYGQARGATICLGEHVGSGGARCYAEMNELIGKHTAVLGATGSGKSGAVAVILKSIIHRGKEQNYKQWKPQIVILDPHNEYGSAFPTHVRLSTDEGTLQIPYWLLNFQETLNLLVGKTEFVATSQANIVKIALLHSRMKSADIVKIDANKITVDSPVPYLLSTLVDKINELRPQNKNQKDQEPYDSVVNKLEVLRRDSRVKFLMDEWDGKTDFFANIISQFMGDSDPIRIVDLSGVPNEVAGIASAAIARILFSFKLWQSNEDRKKNPILLVCEEAHRYVPNAGEAQYEAAQEAIRRLAKEGRKYGIGLMLVSQRPSEVEATVLSQCNSWIVLRITNDKDREHVRSILPDSLAGLTKVLSGLRRREAIFVGQAAILPSRILMTALPEGELPRSHDIDYDLGWQGDALTNEAVAEVGKRWRLQTR